MSRILRDEQLVRRKFPVEPESVQKRLLDAARAAERMLDIAGTLQLLYDSEINFSITCFWDAGFAVKLGDEINGFPCGTNTGTFLEAVLWLREHAARSYPSSEFAAEMARQEAAKTRP